MSPFQLLRDGSDRRTRLHQSGADPGALRALWPGPFWLHLAGVEVFQPLQPPDGRAGPRSRPKRGALRGHAAQHAIVDLLMHPGPQLFTLTPPFSVFCSPLTVPVAESPASATAQSLYGPCTKCPPPPSQCYPDASAQLIHLPSSLLITLTRVWPQSSRFGMIAGGIRSYLFIYFFIHLFPTRGKEWYLMPHITEQTVCASITMSVLGSAWRRPKGVQCILPYRIILILVPNILRCMLHFYLDITKLHLYPICGHVLLFSVSTVCFRKVN